MGLGGPVWHASIKGRYGAAPWTLLEEIAELELRGVGDALRGEWRERGDQVFHLRRRLKDAEMTYAGIVSVCDVRGTVEQAERLRRMRPYLPPAIALMPDEALP